jgi:avidin family protein
MSLTGIWTNELRSRMLVRERPDFGLDGIYQSIVGRDSGFRTLAGRTSKVDGTKQMVAWVVCFEIADPAEGYGHHSVCGWSGWGERDDVSELIKTHWLLTINIYDKKSNWSATHVGEDTFLKINDDADENLFRDMDAIRKLYAEKVAKVREKQS